MERGFPGEAELEEDPVDRLLDGAIAQAQRFRDRRVVLPLGHLAEHVALSLSQLVERRLLASRLLRDERLDDLRIDDRPSLRDSPDRPDELLNVVDALLEQVRAALRPCLEQRERIGRLQVLAEYDHADVR